MKLIEHLNGIIGDAQIENQQVPVEVIRKINEKLPKDFIDFYSHFGDCDEIIGSLIEKDEGYAFDWFYPLTEGIDPIPTVMEGYKGRIPSWLVPFAPDYMGNQFVISVREQDYGSVYLWEHNFEYDEEQDNCSVDEYEDNLIILADSFSGFILSMVEVPEDDNPPAG